jgi:hypothetical protein
MPHGLLVKVVYKKLKQYTDLKMELFVIQLLAIGLLVIGHMTQEFL